MNAERRKCGGGKRARTREISSREKRREGEGERGEGRAAGDENKIWERLVISRE